MRSVYATGSKGPNKIYDLHPWYFFQYKVLEGKRKVHKPNYWLCTYYTKQKIYNDLDNKTEEHFSAAAEAFQQAIELFESIDEKRYLADVYSKIGELYNEVDIEKANKYLRKSVELYQKQ